MILYYNFLDRLRIKKIKINLFKIFKFCLVVKKFIFNILIEEF